MPTFLGLPSGGFDNGAADEAIELVALAGLVLDEWQEQLLRWAMAEKVDRRWAAFFVYLFKSRQNGKGSVLETRQFIGLAMLDKFAIHTAHELKTTAEHFLRMQQLIEGCPEFERRVSKIRTGAGAEAIEMKNGNRLRFIARSGGSGRGFAGVDTLYLDESMYLAEGMMKAIFSTMAAKSKKGNPQLWLTGSAPYGPMTETPGKLEASQQSWMHAQVGMLRNDDLRPANALYLDFGMRPPAVDELVAAGGFDQWLQDVVPDRDRWYAHNAALGERISEEFVASEVSTLGLRGFAVERLGLVIPPDAENRSGIDLDVWAKLTGEFELPSGVPVAVDLDESGSRGSLVSAGVVGGKTAVEVVFQGGVGDIVSTIIKQVGGQISEVVVASDGQAVMVEALLAARQCRVPVRKRTMAHVSADEASFCLAVSDGEVVHRGDVRLRSAILSAEQKQSGDRWRWSRRSVGDPTALIAAALVCSAASSVVPEFFVY